MKAVMFAWLLAGCTPAGLTIECPGQSTAPPPVLGALKFSAGGVALGTYAYRATAVMPDGETAMSDQVVCILGSPSTVHVNWAAVSGALSFKLYGREMGAMYFIQEVPGDQLQAVDDGSVTPAPVCK